MVNKLLHGWQEIDFLECIEKEASNNKLKIPQGEFLQEGEYPVIDQGEKFIAGYTNDKSKVYNEKLPVIVFGDHTRILKYVDFPFVPGADGVKILVPKNNVNPKYFYYVLKKSNIPSAGYSRHYKFLKELKLPLPPPPIQKKIVAILEKAEALKRKREEADRLTSEYLKSAFYGMIGNKDEFPKKAIGELCEVVSGSTPSTIKEKYWNGNIDWVTPAELKDEDNYYYYKSQRKITKEGLDSASTLFPKDTVMLTTRAPIGKVAIAGKEMCTNQGFKNMICKKELNHIYLYCWLLFNKEYLNFLGVGATFKEISKKAIEGIKIPLPPLPLQQKFASIVEYVEKLKERQKQSKERIDELFNSLMQQAFKGALVK